MFDVRLSGAFAATLIALGSGAALAQGAPAGQAGLAHKVGVMERPCDAVEPMPSDAAAYFATLKAAHEARQAPPPPSPEALAHYQAWQQRQLLADFSQRCKYAADNAALPAAGVHRVVMFGDSITELWGMTDPAFFGNELLDRGISGQTTDQMLGRFRTDVIELHPEIVHILAGENDFAGNTGPSSVAWVEGNIKSMVELARSNGIRVVLASALPAARFGWRPEVDPVSAIAALNHWLQAYAKAEKIEFVDYYSVLQDQQHAFKKEFSGDGVHPNAAGYAIMEPLAREALDRTRAGARP